MRDPSITDRLGSANTFPVIFATTNRFINSFRCYALANYTATRDIDIAILSVLRDVSVLDENGLTLLS